MFSKVGFDQEFLVQILADLPFQVLIKHVELLMHE